MPKLNKSHLIEIFKAFEDAAKQPSNSLLTFLAKETDIGEADVKYLYTQTTGRDFDPSLAAVTFQDGLSEIVDAFVTADTLILGDLLKSIAKITGETEDGIKGRYTARCRELNWPDENPYDPPLDERG
jgi:hypothetical protein